MRPFPALSWACVLLALLIAPEARAKSYHAESYSSEIRIERDGTLSVREHVRVRFEGGPFTFFYRGIPFRGADEIEFVSASDSTRLKQRRTGLDVTWRFPALRDTVRDFTLAYRAHGALAVTEAGHRFRRILFPDDRAYRIDRAVARIYLPPGASPSNLRVRPDRYTVRTQAEVLALDAVPLKEQRSITVLFDLPGGAVESGEPAWQQRSQLWRKRTPVFLVLAALVVAAGTAWLIGRSFRDDDRERHRPRGPYVAVKSPPEKISPALAGALRDANVTPAHAIACLLHLADRGALRFEQPEGRSILGRPAPVLYRSQGFASLEPWESIVVEGAFRKGRDPGVVEWGRARSGLTSSMKEFSREVVAALVRRGDFDAGAAVVRSRLNGSSLALLVLSVPFLVLAIVLFSSLGPAGFALPAAFLVLAGLGGILGANIPQWTERGATRAAAWRGFTKHLKETARGTTPLDSEHFHERFSYAVALGVSKEWLAGGKRRGHAGPSWFRTASDTAADLGDLSVFVAASAAAGGSSGGGGAGGSSGAG